MTKVDELMRLADAYANDYAASCMGGSAGDENRKALRTALEAALNAAAVAESNAYLRGYNVGHEAALKPMRPDAAAAAIQFSLSTEDGRTFLELWQYGDFDIIRREWPDVPDAVFVGADPLHTAAPLAQPDAKPDSDRAQKVAECVAAIRPVVCGKFPAEQALQELTGYAAPPAQTPPLTTCNCRWDGDKQVQQCTLHEAHVNAIREWAERAKSAEAKLKTPPPRLTPEQIDQAVEQQRKEFGQLCDKEDFEMLARTFETLVRKQAGWE
jgi:hypothetical protein